MDRAGMRYGKKVCIQGYYFAEHDHREERRIKKHQQVSKLLLSTVQSASADPNPYTW